MKVRNKTKSIFDEMNKIGLFSLDGIAFQGKLGDLQAELNAVEGQISPCKQLLEAMHRAIPFSSEELQEFDLIWTRLKTKRTGIGATLKSAKDRLIAKSIWANLTAQIEGMLELIKDALVDLVFSLRELSGKVLSTLPWVEE